MNDGRHFDLQVKQGVDLPGLVMYDLRNAVRLEGREILLHIDCLPRALAVL